MTLQDRLSELEKIADSKDPHARYTGALYESASCNSFPKLVKALRAALDGIDKWSDYQSGAFATDTLTEIERILNAEGEG